MFREREVKRGHQRRKREKEKFKIRMRLRDREIRNDRGALQVHRCEFSANSSTTQVELVAGGAVDSTATLKGGTCGW